MSSYQSNDATSKPILKLVKRDATPRNSLSDPDAAREWGSRAPDNMPVDRYKVKCESADKVTRYYKPTAEFRFIVVEGEYTGVLLPGWIPTDYRRYRQYCEIALGEELDDNDDPSPDIFVGKVFIVEARYKRTNGKNRTLLDDTVKKGSWDELRADVILGLVK
jgi:hypothetical protein